MNCNLQVGKKYRVTKDAVAEILQVVQQDNIVLQPGRKLSLREGDIVRCTGRTPVGENNVETDDGFNGVLWLDARESVDSAFRQMPDDIRPNSKGA